MLDLRKAINISNTSIALPKISRENNFDAFRFLFAFLVIIHHGCVLAGSKELIPLDHLIRPIARLAVPGFFVISGFLIFMSYEKSKNLAQYTEKRLRRILPAYLFVVLLCAFGGVFFSTFQWNEFFNIDWLKYLVANLGFLNFLYPSLPGVFESNPAYSSVNGSLWTLKIELMFYAVVPILVWFLNKGNKAIWIFAIYISSYIYGEVLFSIGEANGGGIWFLLAKQLPGQLTFFISGALLYYYFDIFKRKLKFLLPVSLLVLIINSPREMLVTDYYEFSFLTPLALAILIISIVFFVPYTDIFGKYGDLSYGMYIYHFPLQQILVSHGFFDRQPYLTLMLSTVAVMILSYGSWHYIEKPFLKRKHVSLAK